MHEVTFHDLHFDGVKFEDFKEANLIKLELNRSKIKVLVEQK